MKRRQLALALGVFVSVVSILLASQGGHNAIGRLGLIEAAPSRDGASRPRYSVAGPSRTEIGGAKIAVEFARGGFALPPTALIAWVSSAARAVTDYYGRFPVGSAKVLIVPVEGRKGVLHGTSWGTHPAFTRVYVGQLVSESELKDDWVMTHEMVHYAFPSVSDQHEWIEEGIATYVEPIARLEAGEIGAAKVWGDLVEGLPYGLPGHGDEGLDHTHTWGRTYWGGAMFCLLAGGRIRRGRPDRYCLREALRP